MSLTNEQLALMRRLNRVIALRVKRGGQMEKAEARYDEAKRRFYEVAAEEAALYSFWREQAGRRAVAV